MPLALLFTGTFALTLWLQSRHDVAGTPAAAQPSRSVIQPPTPRAAQQPVPVDPESRQTSPPRTRLDADPFDALVAAGIGADDSEQRSLAIRELARTPADQAFDGLALILMESQDRRSRLDALDELTALPAGELQASRGELLARLSRDADPAIAEAAIARASLAGQRQ